MIEQLNADGNYLYRGKIKGRKDKFLLRAEFCHLPRTFVILCWADQLQKLLAGNFQACGWEDFELANDELGFWFGTSESFVADTSCFPLISFEGTNKIKNLREVRETVRTSEIFQKKITEVPIDLAKRCPNFLFVGLRSSLHHASFGQVGFVWSRGILEDFGVGTRASYQISLHSKTYVRLLPGNEAGEKCSSHIHHR